MNNKNKQKKTKYNSINLFSNVKIAIKNDLFDLCECVFSYVIVCPVCLGVCKGQKGVVRFSAVQTVENRLTHVPGNKL